MRENVKILNQPKVTKLTSVVFLRSPGTVQRDRPPLGPALSGRPLQQDGKNRKPEEGGRCPPWIMVNQG